MDKVALVNFCCLCRLGSVDGAELREGKYHQERQISLGRQFLSDEIAAPWPELLHTTGLAHTCQEGTTFAQIQTRLRVEAHLTLAGRRKERALHYLLLLPFLPDLLHSILLVDDISPTHSGTIFLLGGWFHSIGLDIYFSKLHCIS